MDAAHDAGVGRCKDFKVRVPERAPKKEICVLTAPVMAKLAPEPFAAAAIPIKPVRRSVSKRFNSAPLDDGSRNTHAAPAAYIKALVAGEVQTSSTHSA